MATPQGTPAQQSETQQSAAAAGTAQSSPSTPSDRETRVPMTREAADAGMTRQQPSLPVSPFALMQALFNDVDRLFGGDLVGGRQRSRAMYRQPSAEAQQGLWAPPVDIARRGDQIVVSAELAGIDPDNVTVEIDDNALMISGERTAQIGDQNYTERVYGSFYRVIPLPDNIDASQVTAVFRNGVLEVAIPVPKEQDQGRRRRVKVQS